MHRFKAVSEDRHKKVILDGKDVTGSCTGYSISDNGGIPKLTIQLICESVEIDVDDAVVTLQEAR